MLVRCSIILSSTPTGFLPKVPSNPKTFLELRRKCMYHTAWNLPCDLPHLSFLSPTCSLQGLHIFSQSFFLHLTSCFPFNLMHSLSNLSSEVFMIYVKQKLKLCLSTCLCLYVTISIWCSLFIFHLFSLLNHKLLRSKDFDLNLKFSNTCHINWHIICIHCICIRNMSEWTNKMHRILKILKHVIVLSEVYRMAWEVCNLPLLVDSKGTFKWYWTITKS